MTSFCTHVVVLRSQEAIDGAVTDHDRARRNADAAARPDADNDRILGSNSFEHFWLHKSNEFWLEIP